jgi:uncharacterized protein YigA (DUF484 family)
MTAEEVARYLRDNPAFLQQHPAVFTELLLPDPHQGNAVSLMERQASLLRERVRTLEARLAELLNVGRENDNLARILVDWTRALLAEPDRLQLARVAARELRHLFGVPLVEIRAWGDAASPGDAAERLVSGLTEPLCGAQIDLAAMAGWNEAWTSVRSAAIIPLRRPGAPQPFGLIALGSSDPERFQANLGTALLARIGELASAALAPASASGAGPG